MKKIFTLIAVAAMAITAKAQGTYLVAFGVAGQENHGYAIGGTTDDTREVKLEDGTKLPALSFNNNWGAGNENYIKLTTDGGFKSGDVVTLSGAIANNDESKHGACRIFTLSSDEKQTVLYTTEVFVNLNIAPTSTLPVYTYTLTEDSEILYLGRDGNTRTQMTMISVVRNGGDTPAPAEGETFTLEGAWPEGDFGTIKTPFSINYDTKTITYDKFLGGSAALVVKYALRSESQDPTMPGTMFNIILESGATANGSIGGGTTYDLDGLKDASVIFTDKDGNNVTKLNNPQVMFGTYSGIEYKTGGKYEISLYMVGKYSKWENGDWGAVSSGNGFFNLVITVPASANGDTGIDSVAVDSVDEDAPVEYYNIQGMHVANPTPGQLVIRRQGNKVSKVIFR